MLIKIVIVALIITESYSNIAENILHPRDPDYENLVELANQHNLTTLVKWLKKTNLDNIIDHEGKFTLFGPTNEAFTRVPAHLPFRFKDVLEFHIARGLLHITDMKNDMTLKTLLSKRPMRINIYKDGKVITANGRRLIESEFTAHNGVLHVVDNVMTSIFSRGGSISLEVQMYQKHRTLSFLIAKSGLFKTLNGTGPFTLFAPTDDAFAKLPPAVLDKLKTNQTVLRQTLLHHIIPATWFTPGFDSGMKLRTLQGGDLLVTKKGDAFTVNEANIIKMDHVALNGAWHCVDTVLLPPDVATLSTEAHNLVELAAEHNLTQLVSLLEQYHLDNIIDHEGTFTLFGPTDSAFSRLPPDVPYSMKDILEFHIARGELRSRDLTNEMTAKTLLSKRPMRINVYKDGKVITANGRQVIESEYDAHNGVLHVIDEVMSSLFSRGGSLAFEIQEHVDHVAFAFFLGQMGLIDKLHSEGPFTVFAPTNEAFDALPESVIQNRTAMTAILLNHIIPHTWFTPGFDSGQKLQTLGKGTLEVTCNQGMFSVNKCPLAVKDRVALNGAWHVIDSLLLPTADTLSLFDQGRYSVELI